MLLFALSLILVGITIYRVVAVIDRHSDQQFRSLIASLEILAAAAVSNALVLGSFVRDRGAKKQRFRFGSVGGGSSLDRTPGPRRTIAARNWGSDADLVGDLGIRLEAGISAKDAIVPRPAPLAMGSQPKSSTSDGSSKDWIFQDRSSAETTETDVKDCGSEIEKPPRAAETGMSFFDVGGLLDDGTAPLPRYPAPMSQSRSSSARLVPHSDSDEFTVHHNRSGRNALLQDIGGLLASEPRPALRISSRNFGRPSPKHEKRGGETSSQEQNSLPSLKDVGGLLA